LILLCISTLVTRAQEPAGGCALLLVAEIQALAGSDKVGPGKGTVDELGSRICEYTWGTGGNVQGGRSFLNVIATPLAKAFPGTNASVLAKGLLANAGKPNTEAIPGVGDAALYESNDPIRVKTTAVAKGTLLIISFESATARAKKDQVTALLKAAVGRL
jgi:hypothetical protein